MFSHIMVGSNDVAASKAFYDATLGVLGAPNGRLDDNNRVFYATRTGVFAVSRPIDGAAATPANGGTIGFTCDSPEMVDAWHAAGLAHGGRTCEDPPGWREMAFGKLYLAYLRDPAGNKLCATHRG